MSLLLLLLFLITWTIVTHVLLSLRKPERTPERLTLTFLKGDTIREFEE